MSINFWFIFNLFVVYFNLFGFYSVDFKFNAAYKARIPSGLADKPYAEQTTLSRL